jgi:hypothetical protein
MGMRTTLKMNMNAEYIILLLVESINTKGFLQLKVEIQILTFAKVFLGVHLYNA